MAASTASRSPRTSSARSNDHHGDTEGAEKCNVQRMRVTLFWYLRLVRGPIRMQNYTAVVERDPDTGLYVGYVPGFAGAHSQAETLDELNRNMKEVIALLLEDGEPQLEAEFVGIQTVVA